MAVKENETPYERWYGRKLDVGHVYLGVWHMPKYQTVNDESLTRNRGRCVSGATA